MDDLTRLGRKIEFPPSSLALDHPNGLLAYGGELSIERLLAAYRRGIFPWYEDPQPVLWWTPDPRFVLFPEELHISRSLRRTLRKKHFGLNVDDSFNEVMQACAAPRRGSTGTWIDREMVAAYSQLNREGIAHSVEVTNQEGELVGGLYGVSLGRVFFGESMFSLETDASKVALVALVDIMRRGNFHMVDCQLENPHLISLGARGIGRLDFEERLAQTVDDEVDRRIWCLPDNCGGLL